MLHILLVEDDINGQNITKSLLESRGFAVAITSNAEEALQLLNNVTFHAAIIDLSLPGLSGWELLNEIEQADLRLPCIAITAYHSSKVAQQTRNAGFIAYFPKPFEVEDFADQITALLAAQ